MHLVLCVLNLREQGAYRRLSERLSSDIIGEPELKETTKAAEVPIDARKLFDASVIEDALNSVAQTDVQ